MQKYSIRKIENRKLAGKIRSTIKNKSAQEGQFVQLEELALLLGLIQQRILPQLKRPQIMIFAADHGYTSAFPDPYPPNATYRDVLNILNLGSAVNAFSRQNGLALKVVDMGVSHRFERMLSFWLSKPVKFLDQKISYGTRNFFENPAMTTAECEQALKKGGDVVKKEVEKGSNILGFGVCASGNRLASLILAIALLDKYPESSDIRNSLSDTEQECANRALRKHPKTHDVMTLLTLYGGFELVALTGAILKAAEMRITVMLEGIAGSVGLLAAKQVNEKVEEYCIISRTAGSTAHEILQRLLNKKPILGNGLGSSDGSSIALAYPLVEGACSFMRDVANREDTDLPDLD